MKILVTGANGFVGQSLCPLLLAAGHEVVAAIRHDIAAELPAAVKCINVGSLTLNTYWRDALNGIDTIVHLAGRTHVMEEISNNPEIAYQQLNVEVTRHLATEAVLHGIKRLVFLSSIKVNGEQTKDAPFTSDAPPAPEDAYGRTKRDAEINLIRATEGTGTEVCILRAPLVYGPGVKGNFLRLLGAIAVGKPLPLGIINNRRSLIYVGNLSSAIAVALTNPVAAGQTYLVSDGEDLSTTNLVRRLAKALGTPLCLLPVPAALLRLAGRLLGRGQAISRLTGSLQVDSNPLRQDLGWQPPFNLDQGLEHTATWYKRRREEHAQAKGPDTA